MTFTFDLNSINSINSEITIPEKATFIGGEATLLNGENSPKTLIVSRIFSFNDDEFWIEVWLDGIKKPIRSFWRGEEKYSFRNLMFKAFSQIGQFDGRYVDEQEIKSAVLEAFGFKYYTTVKIYR